jgi:diacylglycerol kinase family enzyme
MRVMLLYNPVAGSGRAKRDADKLHAALTAVGHAPVLTETRLEPQKQWLDPQMDEFDLVVVVGGDGAVRLASGAAGRTSTPLYHFPLGTENLFAREFRKSRSVERLLAAIDRFEVRRFDLGIANNRKFLLMASIGFDADVVHDLAGARGSGISHLSYVPPIIRQIFRWRSPNLRVRVDGDTIVNGRRGTVIVANSRQYALRVDPATRADMTDGLLDVLYLPARSVIGVLWWSVACRFRWHLLSRRSVYRTGHEIEVLSDEPLRYQLDGDRPELHVAEPETSEDDAAAATRLRVTVRPGVVPVLIP